MEALVWQTFLLGMLHVSLSLLVTAHILLTKRDTAAAAGWIGFCWVMPYFGSLLYLCLGINRVHRRAQKLREDVSPEETAFLATWSHDASDSFMAPLVKMLDELTGLPLLKGNSVDCLHDGDRAYPKMLEAIAQAERSILLCSYIFRHDEIGKQFVAALVEARQRGVEVRVLVDGIGSGYLYSPIIQRLKRESIPCARFMHSLWPWRMPFINLRDHRKILVVDGRIGFMGGLNIGAENLLNRPRGRRIPVADTHFRLEGPVVQQLSEVFARDWVFTTGETLEGERYFPVPVAGGTIPARVVTSGPDMDVEKIEYTILQAVILARSHVCFMTPYFIPDNRFATELGLAALRGVRVDIVVPQHSNHPVTDYARNACLKELVQAGCRVWLGEPPFNHSKLMTVDQVWSFVGSANLDRRSLRLNFECNMTLHDAETTGHLEKFILSHCNQQLTLEEIDSWSMPVRLRNAACCLFLPYL
ncbi:phospholipase D [Bombella intestini]|uniref:Phospholipase D n=1 Tax=Bombella intestini TaxID=1539051 RepID=A0A1S8GR86_9PROT|nr:phospholipase D-like domain-containing protein [Bombella intestini]OOL19542.1 phospholipase D [Bombella intestini]